MLETVSETEQTNALNDVSDANVIKDVNEEAIADTSIVDDDHQEIDDVEMSLFDHLEEFRSRILYALIAVFVGVIGCFAIVNKIVALLEIPAQGVKFLQLAPGEYFFVSIKVAGYSGILVASPAILYQIVSFILPGLTRKEKRTVAPIVFGSSI